MNITEETFVSWSQGPGSIEAERCENAEVAVRKAIAADGELSALDISVFAQGSYRARTNVRQDSDVDVCVRCNSTFFADYPEGLAREHFDNVASAVSFADFKNLVERALRNYFGTAGVTRGNKAFDVQANSYRIDADVVPTFEHRRYSGNVLTDGSWEYHSGVAFRPDSGGLIKNWPTHNYDNGVARNDATGRRYKRVIRILKRLRNKMQEDGVAEAKNVASFLIECLVWNAPSEALSLASYSDALRSVLLDLWDRTRSEEKCNGWGEVNEMKYLFRPSQPWTREQANAFLAAAWNYIGYK